MRDPDAAADKTVAGAELAAFAPFDPATKCRRQRFEARPAGRNAS